ncbi:MAG TPA: amidohydrolase family protein [Longimicrobiaceae bacterium]|nr:amidohydrolase family protein [Longimicrobiaceae bacterium]
MQMRRLFLGVSLIAAGACSSAGAPPSPPAPNTLAITGVTVVDVTGGPSRPEQTVLVAGNRIVAIGRAADVRVPRGARVVDGAGRYLIPGLWDVHTHVVGFGREALPLFLANGVTGIRDMGAERFAAAKALRDSIAAGTIVGPRMTVASPVVENPRWLAAIRTMEEKAGLPWKLYERFGPRSPEEAVRWVDSVAALGADHIKVRNWPDTVIGGALVARARERGLPVVGHANEPFPRTGITTYEHGIWPPLKGSDAARDSLWRRFAGGGSAVVPTLVTWPIRLDPPDTLLGRLESGRIQGLRYVPAEARAEWRDALVGLKQESPFDWTGYHRVYLRDVAEMHRAGVPLMAGTDIGAPLLVPGFSLHDEIALLASVAGMTPLQALQSATLIPARVLGMADSLGTVAVGKLADLVLLDADPLADIGNTRRIHAVVADGRLLDRAELDRLLAEAEQAATPRAR